MKNIVRLISLVFLVGCLPGPEPEPVLSAITCVIVSGEPMPAVCPIAIGTNAPFTEMTMRYGTPSGFVPLASADGCFFPANDIALPGSGQNFSLEMTERGIKRKATVTVPPSPENINADQQQFSVLTNSEHPVSTVSWAAMPGYSFALKLDVLDPNPVAIPFAGISGGKFQKELSGVQIAPSVALFNTDFAYYGQHKLTVFSLDDQYASLFAYLPQFGGSALGQGPGNFDRGPGILGAVGKTEIYFEILP